MNSSVLSLIKENDSMMTDLRLGLWVSPGSIRETEPLGYIFNEKIFLQIFDHTQLLEQVNNFYWLLSLFLRLQLEVCKVGHWEREIL